MLEVAMYQFNKKCLLLSLLLSPFPISAMKQPSESTIKIGAALIVSATAIYTIKTMMDQTKTRPKLIQDNHDISHSDQSLLARSKADTFFEYLRKLPVELQEQILLSQDSTLLQDTINFLGLQPITLTQPSWNRCSVLIAISDDRMITISDGHTAKIWNANTGECLLTLTGPSEHTSPILSVAISGNRVVTGSSDHTAKIWDVNTGACLFTLAGPNGHTDAIYSVAINSDKVATGSGDGTTQIWNINNGELLLTIVGYIDKTSNQKKICSVAIDDEKVLTESPHGILELRSINSGKLLFKGEGYSAYDKIFSIATSGNLRGIHQKYCYLYQLYMDIIRALYMYDMYTDFGQCQIGSLIHEIRHELAGKKLLYEYIDQGYWKSTHARDLVTSELLRLLKKHKVMSGDKAATVYNRSGYVQIWPSFVDLRGTPDNNSLLWIIQKTNMLQLDFIKRVCAATSTNKEFIIDLPEKLGKIKEDESQEQADGRLYFTFPADIREYLRNRLNIRRPVRYYLTEVISGCLIQ